MISSKIKEKKRKEKIFKDFITIPFLWTVSGSRNSWPVVL